jgi:phosphoglycolate phosphatase
VNLIDLLARKPCLLLDFDGPICAVFAGYTTEAAASELRAVIADRRGSVPHMIDEVGAHPLGILRRVAGLGDPELTRAVADTCRDAEVRAVATAAPTPGAGDVLRAAHDGGRQVAIVSNNSGEAVRTYLDAHDLNGYVDHIAARYDGMDPHRLKPNPHLVDAAISALRARSADAILVGDSDSDIEAGRAAAIVTIGYANKPGKRERLANADTVIDTMTELADALRLVAAPS